MQAIVSFLEAIVTAQALYYQRVEGLALARYMAALVQQTCNSCLGIIIQQSIDFDNNLRPYKFWLYS